MRIAFVIIGAIFLPVLIQAQSTGRISGIVTDLASKQALEGATISVLNHSTGIFINHGVSNKKGAFQVTGLPLNQQLEVNISFTGYQDTTALQVLKADNKSVNTGIWRLHVGGGELDSVVFIVHKPPFIVRKDTLEFDASAFKSLPADMLEDLLRKLPGLIIDEQGNVTVNGKKVNKIRVDGRDFFGGNLKTAMENLPGTVIDKVQVYDSRERGAGHDNIIQPLASEVTLNVTLKKQYKKAVFGHTGAAAGTSDRYAADAFLNNFNGDQRQSVYARIGNAATGHPQREDAALGGGGQGSGILKNSAAGGINFSIKSSKKSNIDASYFTENDNSSSAVQTDRTNILPDSTFLYNNLAQSTSITHSHRLQANYINNIDTLQELSISPSFNYNDNITRSSNLAHSLSSVDSALINSQENHVSARNRSYDFNNRINYNRSSRDHKTNLSLTWSFGIRQSTGVQANTSQNIFYNNSSIVKDSLDQQDNTSNNGVSNTFSLNLYHTFSKHFTGIIHYNFSQSADNTDRDTYNYDGATGKHDLLDSLYSAHNHNTSYTHLPSVSMGYTAGKWTVQLGAGLRLINQENRIVWKDSSIIIRQKNIAPNITTSYRINKSSIWITGYSVNASQPSPDQLAPVQDNTNPLYTQVGNPFLKSSITHNIHSELQSYSRDYKWHVTLQGSGVITEHQIVDDTYYDSLGRQISSYANTSGNRQVNVNLNTGARINLNQWNINLDIASSFNSSRSTGFINRQQNISTTASISPQFIFSINYKEYFFLLINTGIDINSTSYSLTGINGIDYNTKRLLLAVRAMPVKRLVINGSINYFYNSQLPEGFQRSRTLINTSVDYNFLKSEKLSVGLAVNDILNNNINITRTVTPTAIENTQTDALKRYGVLNVKYRFNTFRTTHRR